MLVRLLLKMVGRRADTSLSGCAAALQKAEPSVTRVPNALPCQASRSPSPSRSRRAVARPPAAAQVLAALALVACSVYYPPFRGGLRDSMPNRVCLALDVALLLVYVLAFILWW